MADGLNVKVKAKLNIDDTTKQIQLDLQQVANNIKPIQISAQINTDAIKQQTQQIQSQISSTVSNVSNSFKSLSFDNVFKFNTKNAQQLFSQLDAYKEKLNELSKIAPAIYTTHTNKEGNIDTAKFTYYNDQLKQTVTETYEVDKASQEAINSINRMVLTGTTYSTKAYQAAQATEKFNQQLSAFKNTVNSFGDKNTGVLLDNNKLGTKYQNVLNSLNSVSDTKGLSAVNNQFKELQAQTSSYIQDQKILKTEVNNTTNAQIKDLEILTKSEQQRQAEIQKTSNKIEELTANYNKFQAQLSKNEKGISLNSLNQENVSGLQSALNTSDIQQATHYLKLLKTEYSELNEAMDKPFSSNALEKFETRAQKLSQDIGTIESKFSNVNLGGMPGYSTQVQQVSENISQLRTNLDAFNNAQIGQDKVEAFNKLNSSVKETKKQVDDLFKSQKALESLAGTSNRFEAYLNENTKVAKQFPDAVNQIRVSLQGLNSETDMTKLTTGLQNVKGKVSTLEATAKQAGIEGRTILGELGNDIKKMLQWTVGGTAIFGTINEIKQMVSNVSDLNKSLVNIQMATGASNDEAGKMMNTYAQMGQTLGATTTEVATSADSFLRQGKSVSETNDLIKDSMVLSKIGEIKSGEATDYLTSAMKGYGVATKDAISIVDKLSAVDMQSATSAGGLAEGMAKTANMANSAGRIFARPYSNIWVA